MHARMMEVPVVTDSSVEPNEIRRHNSKPEARFAILAANRASRLTEFCSNLKDFLSGPPFWRRTAAASGIWSRDAQFTRVEALSLSIHVLVFILIISPLIPGIVSPATQTRAYPLAPFENISAYLRQ
jgi:hypothetical protein